MKQSNYRIAYAKITSVTTDIKNVIFTFSNGNVFRMSRFGIKPPEFKRNTVHTKSGLPETKITAGIDSIEIIYPNTTVQNAHLTTLNSYFDDALNVSVSNIDNPNIPRSQTTVDKTIADTYVVFGVKYCELLVISGSMEIEGITYPFTDVAGNTVTGKIFESPTWGEVIGNITYTVNAASVVRQYTVS